MIKKNKVPAVRDANCLNCGCPFTNNEKFCPECGQKNRGKKITLATFLRELFAGFFSLDTKFWRTLIPLLISPGKVSKDYIEGKRVRYTNPFRFYLATTIIFFLILGAINSYDHFERLRKGTLEKSSPISVNNENNQEKILSIGQLHDLVFGEIKINQKKLDSLNLNKKDSVPQLDSIVNNYNNSTFYKLSKFEEKNPTLSSEKALDSLGIEKNFSNRFLYSKVKLVNSYLRSDEEHSKFNKQLYSHISISLFVLLPLFTLFLSFIYIRRKFTYVEHLVFVFHVQTVFFLLASIFYIIGFINKSSNNLPTIFSILFLLYLFIAMKKFYGQSFFKTLIKYFIINTVFVTLMFFGIVIVWAITFALY